MKEEDNDVCCDEESFREIENLTVFHLHTMKILKSVIEELAAFLFMKTLQKIQDKFFRPRGRRGGPTCPVLGVPPIRATY